ncbi:hypothetical protein PSN01_00235 [Micromonospora saelicesensis]|nr:hypothetical protein PSN01_00235 [Micromonospora saelicesensis]
MTNSASPTREIAQNGGQPLRSDIRVRQCLFYHRVAMSHRTPTAARTRLQQAVLLEPSPNLVQTRRSPAQLPCRLQGRHLLCVDPTEQVDEFPPGGRSAIGAGRPAVAFLPIGWRREDGEVGRPFSSPGVGRGLAVAVRAEEPQVRWPVVEEVPVDVVDVQDERRALPDRPYPTALALLRHAECAQRPLQPHAGRPAGPVGQHNQELRGCGAPFATPPLVVGLPREVRRVDAEPLELPADVRVRATADAYAEQPHHLGDVAGDGGSGGQRFGRVLVSNH